MTHKINEPRIAVLNADLLISLNPNEKLDEVHDIVNMMLIPLQIKEGGESLVDYAFNGEPRGTHVKVSEYDYDNGLPQRVEPRVIDAPRSAEELDAEYNPDGDGEHPVHTRESWRHAVADETTVSGYWQWLANTLEQQGFDRAGDVTRGLLVAAVEAKMRYWDALREIEIHYLGNGDVPDKVNDALEELMSTLSAPLDDPDQAERMIEQEHVDMLDKVFA